MNRANAGGYVLIDPSLSPSSFSLDKMPIDLVIKLTFASYLHSAIRQWTNPVAGPDPPAKRKTRKQSRMATSVRPSGSIISPRGIDEKSPLSFFPLRIYRTYIYMKHWTHPWHHVRWWRRVCQDYINHDRRVQRSRFFSVAL